MAGRHLPSQRRPRGALRVDRPLTVDQAAELSRRIEGWHLDVDAVAPGPPPGPERAAAVIFLAGLVGLVAIALVPLAVLVLG